MRLKSRVPPELFGFVDGVSRASSRYVEGLDRRIPARDDLAGGATLAQTIAAFNLLLADLRENGLMERT